MFEGLLSYLLDRSSHQLARDALDVILVYYVVYRALLVLKGTRAMQVGIGLGFVFVLYVVAQLLQLVTLLSIVGALVSSIILVIVVVFASDIRRGLQRVGSSAWFGSFGREQESAVIDEVVSAATDLARHRIGAIITFEQDANLDEFVGAHTGRVIDAKVSRELLVSLFIPEATNQLHDGAVVISNLRIAKAGVFFPMPEARVKDTSFGSRHRAALGITEETDAVVVVVSEERGTISFCFNGNIASNLDGPKLRTMLEAIFSPRVRKRTRKAAAKRASQPKVEAPMAAEGTPLRARVSVPDSTPIARVNRTSVVEPLRQRASPASEPPLPLKPRGAPQSDAPPASGDAARWQLTTPDANDRAESRPMPRASSLDSELQEKPSSEDSSPDKGGREP
ncbi:MAG TPA: diadenylate cyclase CdaA [Polyangiaceae bacterium]|jgi:uncharacterized protein (TIGR00159 family)